MAVLGWLSPFAQPRIPVCGVELLIFMTGLSAFTELT